jgi:hypothetical protein
MELLDWIMDNITVTLFILILIPTCYHIYKSSQSLYTTLITFVVLFIFFIIIYYAKERLPQIF